MTRDEMPYGTYNGKPVYGGRDNWIYTIRRFGPIESDEELLEYASKVTSNWYRGGWHHEFVSFYLSSHALAEPYRHLTNSEFARLKAMQDEAIAEYERQEEARQWRKIETTYWADNSIDELWEDKDGVQKRVMVVGPHGDACY